MSGFIKQVADKIKSVVQPAAQPPVVSPEKKPGPDPTPAVMLLAWQAPVKNRQLLIAYKPNTDPNNPNNLVSVHVRDNGHYLRGMKLPARLVKDKEYDLVGPLPRWRGRQ